MEKTPLIIAVLIVVISLVVSNLGFRGVSGRETREISDYEYTILQTTVGLYSEIANAAREELKHEVVTIAQYQRIMRQADIVRSRHAMRRTAMRDSAQ